MSGKECYRLKIVQGDLDHRESVVRVFKSVEQEGGFWGVFVVLQFPGLGVDASGEERQGKVCVFLAIYLLICPLLFFFLYKGFALM